MDITFDDSGIKRHRGTGTGDSSSETVVRTVTEKRRVPGRVEVLSHKENSDRWISWNHSRTIYTESPKTSWPTRYCVHCTTRTESQGANFLLAGFYLRKSNLFVPVQVTVICARRPSSSKIVFLYFIIVKKIERPRVDMLRTSCLFQVSRSVSLGTCGLLFCWVCVKTT